MLHGHRNDSFVNHGLENGAKFLLPFPAVWCQSTAEQPVPLPAGSVCDLVQKRGEESVGIEVVVDRDPVKRHAPARRPVIAQLRPSRPGHTELDGLTDKQMGHIGHGSWRKPRPAECQPGIEWRTSS